MVAQMPLGLWRLSVNITLADFPTPGKGSFGSNQYSRADRFATFEKLKNLTFMQLVSRCLPLRKLHLGNPLVFIVQRINLFDNQRPGILKKIHLLIHKSDHPVPNRVTFRSLRPDATPIP